MVNDGSWDGTYEAAKATRQALMVNLPNNLGIGGAVQTGFKWAARHGYRIAIQFDGDGQHIAAEIPKLLAALKEKKAGMVIGSRFIERHSGYRSTFVRRLGIRVFKAVNSLLIGQTITDNTSGFRAYDRRTIEFLARHYPVDYPEPEAVILLGKNGFPIAEVFTRMRERQSGGSSITGAEEPLLHGQGLVGYLNDGAAQAAAKEHETWVLTIQHNGDCRSLSQVSDDPFPCPRHLRRLSAAQIRPDPIAAVPQKSLRSAPPPKYRAGTVAENGAGSCR